MVDLRIRVVWRTLLAVALVGAIGFFSVPACAQAGFKSDPVDQRHRRNGTRAKRFAKAPTSDAKDKADFGGYVLRYYLPLLTRPEPEALARLADLRYDFFRSFIWGADPSIQRVLTPRIFDKMTKIVRDRQYHPSVRYNAILMIGLLDTTYANDASATKPLPNANALLTAMVQQGVEKSAVPAPLLVGALIGLERHAKSWKGLPAQHRTATVDALLAVLAKEDLPQDISTKVQRWIKVIAVRGLANTGSLGEGAKIHKAFLALLVDENFRLNNRVQIVALLGEMGEAYKSAADIDQKETAQALLSLASAIAADEKQRAEDFENLSLSTGGGRSFSELEGMPSEYQIRRLVMRLRSLQKGLRAVRPVIQDEKLRTSLSQIATLIGPVLASAQDKDVRELNLAGDVKRMADAIEGVALAQGVDTKLKSNWTTRKAKGKRRRLTRSRRKNPRPKRQRTPRTCSSRDDRHRERQVDFASR